MKKTCGPALLAMALFLCACGNDENFTTDISMTTVTWQGNVLESAYYQDFDDANECAAFLFGCDFTGSPPDLVIVAGNFTCGGTPDNAGCFTKWNNTITVVQGPYTKHLVRHEELHRVTGMGNEGHDTPVFQRCQGPLDSSPPWDWKTNTP